MNHQSFKFCWTTINFLHKCLGSITWCFDNITWESSPSNIDEKWCSVLLMLVKVSKSCVSFVCRGVWNQAGTSLNIHLIIAYSRPILGSIIARYPLLQKLCKALFWCKTLKKIFKLWGDFWALSSTKCLYCHGKVPFLRNIECCLKFLEYALLIKTILYSSSMFLFTIKYKV